MNVYMKNQKIGVCNGISVVKLKIKNQQYYREQQKRDIPFEGVVFVFVYT